MDIHNSQMLHHPLKLGCNDQQKTVRRPVMEFVAELTLLSHQFPQLDRIELAILKSYQWIPSLPDPVIGKTSIPSAQDALKDWADDLDRWHMDDGALYVSLEQALTEPWCRHKSKRELIRFLRSVDFPPPFLQLNKLTQKAYVTKKAYEKALEIAKSRRHEEQKLRMQKSRKQIITN